MKTKKCEFFSQIPTGKEPTTCCQDGQEGRGEYVPCRMLDYHRMRSRWWFVAALGVTAVVTLVIVFWRLGARPVENWDEAIHGLVSREQVQRGDWVDLWYRGGHYFRKPPLSFWLRSLAILALGDGVWALRIWSALAGLATTVLLGLWAWQLWQKRWLALLAVVVFATGRYVFYHAFRTGEADGLLTFFVTLALYAYWRSWSAPRWLWLAGAATGLAVMTKSAGGLLPGLIILVHLLATRRWTYRKNDVLGALGMLLLITLPWHALEWLRHGSQFWRDYVGLHVVARATGELHNQGVGPFWYVGIFLKRFYPWSVFFPFAFLSALARLRTRGQQPEGLLVAWFVVTFLVFSLAKTKFDWYLLPLYPAATLLVTPWLATLTSRPRGWTAGAHAVSYAGFILFLPGAIHPDSILRWMFPLTFFVGLNRSLPYIDITALFAIGLWIFLRSPRPAWLSPTAGALALTHVLLLSVGFSLLTIRAERRAASPLPAVVEAIAAARPRKVYVKGVDLYRYPAADWYLKSIRGAELVDLSRLPAPEGFSAGDVVVLRDPATLPMEGLREVRRTADFRVLLPSTP